jgi:hypothetical protein
MLLFLACAHPTSLPIAETEPSLKAASSEASALVESARMDTQVYDRLVELCDHHPARLAGTASLEGATHRVEGWLNADHQENVRLEPAMVPVWVRGQESLELLSPQSRPIEMLGLGGSVGTPGLEAPVVVIHSFEELSPAVSGKIVLFNVPMKEATPSVSAYGEAVNFRVNGASKAAKFGAVGMVLRSVTTRSLNTPHTGVLHYEEGIPQIPAAAIPPEQADWLERMTKEGEVRLRLKMEAHTLPDAPSANVVGEIRGREKPDEIVILGAHLDSWDVGEVANDDGSGVVEVAEALRLLRASGKVPLRTVRAVLYTNEENGGAGGKAYAAVHGSENTVAAVETDLGGGRPMGWGSTGSPSQLEWFLPVAARTGLPRLRDGGGADIGTLTGVLQIGLYPDDRRYFDYHHTQADTVDHVDPASLREGLAAILDIAWELAESPSVPPKP